MKISKKYPGLCKELTPAGTTRWRVRSEGQTSKKITLPVRPDDERFEDHYLAARAGVKLEVKPAPKRVNGTLDDLCARFLDWMEVEVKAGNLKQATLTSRATGLRQACDCKSPSGKLRVGVMKADLPRSAFALIRDSFGARTAAASACLKALRAAYAWGEDYGFPIDSPVFKVKTKHVNKGGAIPWSEADEAQFLAKHGPGTMARRWFLLAKNMAGRIGDIYIIGPKSITRRNGRTILSWQPEKKGSKPVEAPLMSELAAELELGPLHNDALLVTAKGQPFASKDSLGNKIAEWVVQADLCKDVEVTCKESGEKTMVKKAACSQHGIRKMTAHELAKAGATVFEIGARLSRSDFKSSEPYVKGVDRAHLAQAGFDRVETARREQSVPRPENRGTDEVLKAHDTRESEPRWYPQGESNPCFHRERVMS